MSYLINYRNRPQNIPRDISNLKLRDVVSRIKSNPNYFLVGDGILSGGNDAGPEISSDDAALSFYLANAVAAEVHRVSDPAKPVPFDLGGFLTRYHNVLTMQSIRMFAYLLFICTRETRHAIAGDAFYSAVAQHWSPAWIRSIRNQGSGTVIEHLNEVTPEFTLGEFCDHNCYVFENGVFSTNYGGMAWHKVASCLNDFVHGRISAETMVDTAYTLAHNTGPIFNKGMLFRPQNATRLHTILDVQRAGFIPQYCLNTEGTGKVCDQHIQYATAAVNLLPGLAGRVDWVIVDKIGVGNYALQAQKSKPAEPPPPTAKYFTLAGDKFEIIDRAPAVVVKKKKSSKKETA